MTFRRAITDREHFEILMYVAVTNQRARARAIEYAGVVLYRNQNAGYGGDESFDASTYAISRDWLNAMRKGDAIPKFPAGFRIPAKDFLDPCGCGHGKGLHVPFCKAPGCRCDGFDDDLPF